MKHELSRRTLLMAAAATAISSRGGGQPASHRPIVLGQVALSFYAVTGAVIQELLERLGHPVEVRQGSHEDMFPLLAAGEIDLMAAAWLPEGHAADWARYGGAAEPVAKLHDGAHFFWAVPDYVPASEVNSIADLARPAVASRVAKLIQGLGSGAAITVRSHQAITEHGLDKAGHALRPARRQSPRGVLGGASHAALVGPTARLRTLPPATLAALAKVELGMAAVTEMDVLVNVGKQTPREAARIWMRQNDSLVAGWLTP